MTEAFELLLLEQSGAFTRVQAREPGVTYAYIRAQVDRERWQRTFIGVFVGHNGPLADIVKLGAALLACGRAALLSHDSAAHLQGLLTTAPHAIHVSIPFGRRIAARPGIVVHPTKSPIRKAPVGGPPQASVEDTVLDRVDDANRPDRVVALVVLAISARRTTSKRLSAVLATRSRARWRLLLPDLLTDGAGIESPLEW